MEASDLAAIGYALQMLAFAVLSMLFLARRQGSPFSAYLGIASAASSLQGGILTLVALNVISFGAIVILTEWARGLLWILALFMILRALDKQRFVEKYARRYMMPLLIVALAALMIYSSTKFESLAIPLVVGGGVLMAVMLISLLEQIYRNLPSDSTSSLRYVCIGLFVVSAYDLVFFLRATLGDYDVVVENPSTTTGRLADGFQVVTPNMVRLTTSFGDIVMELVDDAPITTENFLQYVEDDFYEGTIFHRIVAGFVVQGGGFLPGMIQPPGLRDPIMNEFSPTRSNLRATVAMAKLGGDPDSATSQFFVSLVDNSAILDGQNGGFTVFAIVVEGMDVVDAIAAVAVDGNSLPLEDVLLIRAERE